MSGLREASQSTAGLANVEDFRIDWFRSRIWNNLNVSDVGMILVMVSRKISSS
jgi:hypothetical protein